MIETRANMAVEGELLAEEGGKRVKLAFDWQGMEVTTFERFESRDSHPVGGGIKVEIPLRPGEYGITLIEGARGIQVHPLEPEQYKRSLGAGGNYSVGNWAILMIRAS